MIIVSNSTAQTLTTGQSLTFDLRTLKTGCSEYATDGGSAVYLKPKGLYLVDFSANVTNSAANALVQLQIEVNGQPLANTIMNATPATAGDLWNVSRATAVDTNVCCCFNIGTAFVSVTNTGANPVVVAPGASLRIGRVG